MIESYGGLNLKKIPQDELDILIDAHNLYIEMLGAEENKGEKLILDEIDFRESDLSKLNFASVYIMSSLFENVTFADKYFGDAKFYSCIFNKVTFHNIRFRKTVFDYSQLNHCTFDNSTLIRCDTYETIYKNNTFKNCDLILAFTRSDFDECQFVNCQFQEHEFFASIINQIQFIAPNEPDYKNIITHLNIGTFENKQIIEGEEAVQYFIEHSSFIKA